MTSSGRLPGPPSSARRLQIADAAIALVAQQGIGRLSHRAIDRQLEFTEGSTSYYFRRRIDLVRAVCCRLAQRIMADLHWSDVLLGDPSPNADIGDLAQNLAKTVSSWLSTENRPRTLALFEIIQASAREPEIAAIIAEEWAAVTAFNRAFYSMLGVGGDDAAMEPFRALLVGLMFRAAVSGSSIIDGMAFTAVLRDTFTFLASRGREAAGEVIHSS